jgi:hypothetical protein
MGVLNGGGWVCIYSHQPLPICFPLSTNCGRSVPLVRMVRHCTSTFEIAMVSSNDYINGYSALNVSSDVGHSSRGRSRRAPRTVREDAKNIFYRTRHLRFFLVFQQPDGPRIGRTIRAWFRTVLSSPSDSPQCKCVICIVPIRGSL